MGEKWKREKKNNSKMLLKDFNSKGRPNVLVFCIMSLNLSMCIMYIFWVFSLQSINVSLYNDQTKSFDFFLEK